MPLRRLNFHKPLTVQTGIRMSKLEATRKKEIFKHINENSDSPMMVAVWHLKEGRIYCKRWTSDYLRGDYSISLELLAKELEKDGKAHNVTDRKADFDTVREEE